MRTAGEGAAALRIALRAEGGTLADVVAPPTAFDGADAAGAAQLAAAGPRARGHELEYELLLEMILEGVLLHYGASAVAGRPRTIATDDPDLALLLGDQLYALGLSRLAALGDLEAVAELGDVISLIAQAAAKRNEPLIAAVWTAGTAAIGWGSDQRYLQAKGLAREERAEAVAELSRMAERCGTLPHSSSPEPERDV